MYIKLEKESSHNRSQKNAVFQTAKLAVLVVTGSRDKTLVLDKFHDHSDQMFIPKKSEETYKQGHGARQSHMPPSDRRIDKKSSMFLSTKQLDPRLTFALKPSVLSGKQWIDNWFDASR